MVLIFETELGKLISSITVTFDLTDSVEKSVPDVEDAGNGDDQSDYEK